MSNAQTDTAGSASDNGYLFFGDIGIHSISELWDGSHLVLVVLPTPKKLSSIFITKSGRSSGIQCPELGTLMPMTFSANIFIPYITEGIVILPPNAGLYPALNGEDRHYNLSL